MAKADKIYVRIAFEDLLIPKEELDGLTISVVDGEANPLEISNYIVGYEFEDSTECDENGKPL